ncbi:hypothetical protein SpCBS45565_g06118 [Spizellomyces sp. 'palustris']|nr:hypothetical protein SpCBS45565_g06118 [Spizellomyces sp. 'palustris']
MATIALRKHVPLIKFLGPRRFLKHPSTSQAAQPQTVATPQRVGNAVTYEAVEQMPRRFHKRAFSQKEIEAVDSTSGLQFLLLAEALSSVRCKAILPLSKSVPSLISGRRTEQRWRSSRYPKEVITFEKIVAGDMEGSSSRSLSSLLGLTKRRYDPHHAVESVERPALNPPALKRPIKHLTNALGEDQTG